MANTFNLEKEILHRPFADLTSIKAWDTSDTTDGVITIILTMGIFKFNKTSAVVADDLNIIQPTTGGGRWFRQTMPEFKIDGNGKIDVSILPFSSPLQFKGSISVAADFPTLVEVQDGWFYIIDADVTDNDPTKTNTGQSFSAGDEIAWNGTNWSEIGSVDLWIDNGSVVQLITPRDIDLQSKKLVNVLDPVNGGDAVNLSYLNNKVQNNYVWDGTDAFSVFYTANNISTLDYPVVVSLSGTGHTIDAVGSPYSNLKNIQFSAESSIKTITIADTVTMTSLPHLLQNVSLISNSTSYISVDPQNDGIWRIGFNCDFNITGSYLGISYTVVSSHTIFIDNANFGSLNGHAIDLGSTGSAQIILNKTDGLASFNSTSIYGTTGSSLAVYCNADNLLPDISLFTNFTGTLIVGYINPNLDFPLSIANGGTNSSTTLTNNKVMVSSAGSIVESTSVPTGTTATTPSSTDTSTKIANVEFVNSKIKTFVWRSNENFSVFYTRLGLSTIETSVVVHLEWNGINYFSIDDYAYTNMDKVSFVSDPESDGSPRPIIIENGVTFDYFPNLIANVELVPNTVNYISTLSNQNFWKIGFNCMFDTQVSWQNGILNPDPINIYIDNGSLGLPNLKCIDCTDIGVLKITINNDQGLANLEPTSIYGIAGSSLTIYCSADYELPLESDFTHFSGTITISYINPDPIAIAKTDTFTATASQTDFTLSETPTYPDPGFLTRNGNVVYTYTITGTTLTWTGAALLAGEEIAYNYSYGGSSVSLNSTDITNSSNLTGSTVTDVLNNLSFKDSGSDATMGIITLTGSGSYVVSTTKVAANSVILLTVQQPAGNTGNVKVASRVVGTGFTITANGGDTSNVGWVLINPNT